jgi:predicted phosphodiesterase
MNMKVLIATDIHWNYSPTGNDNWKRYLLEKTKEGPFDYVILGGDNGSNDPLHEIECFSVVKDIFPDSDIRYVAGNHSHWYMNGRSGVKKHKLNNAKDVVSYIQMEAEKLGVTYLQDDPIVDDDSKTLICGYSGWYEQTPMSTNDRNWIPDYPTSDEWLRSHAHKGFDNCIRLCSDYKEQGYKTMVVSHFPIFPEVEDWKSNGGSDYFGGNRSFANHLENVDDYVFGHVHKFHKGVAKNGVTQYFSAGSDYERPRSSVYEF